MNSKIVGVTAILATFVILAYAVVAANQNAVDNSQACDHASDNGKNNSNENSVLSSCVQPPSGCSDGTPEGECNSDSQICQNGELVLDPETCGPF